MQYNSLLRWTLVPTIFLFVICFACMALTTHSWIMQDWMIPRYTRDEQRLELIKDLLPGYSDIKFLFIEYIAAPTDAMLAAACLGVGTGIVCIIAWYKLRRADMDMEHNLPRRRFWVGFAVLTLMTSFSSALAALIMAYTSKGPDDFGCTLDDNALGEPIFWCTREMAGCNALPAVKKVWDLSKESGVEYMELAHPWAVDLSCKELVALKWMQVVIMVTSVIAIALFLLQSLQRKKTRYERVLVKGKEKEGFMDEPRQWNAQDAQWKPAENFR